MEGVSVQRLKSIKFNAIVLNYVSVSQVLIKFLVEDLTQLVTLRSYCARNV